MPQPIFLDVRLWTNLMQQSIICENDCFLYSQIDTDTFVNFARLAQVRLHFTCTIALTAPIACMMMHKIQPESHSTSAPMQVLMPTANNSSLHWIGPLHGMHCIDCAQEVLSGCLHYELSKSSAVNLQFFVENEYICVTRLCFKAHIGPRAMAPHARTVNFTVFLHRCSNSLVLCSRPR